MPGTVGSRKIQFKTWNPCANKPLSAVSQFSVIKCYQTRRVEVEFGRSAFPQHLMYSVLRHIYSNYALWIVTTNFLRTLKNQAPAKFATQVISKRMSFQTADFDLTAIRILNIYVRTSGLSLVFNAKLADYKDFHNKECPFTCQICLIFYEENRKHTILVIST